MTTRFLARTLLFTTLLASSLLLIAQQPTPAADPAPRTTHGVDLSAIDKSVKPGDDFFHYSNGEWIKRTEIPADRGSIGVFAELDQIASKRTAAIIEEAAKQGGAPGS